MKTKISPEEPGIMMSEKKGFTLIELLVVIAIIALLISILMPALSRAKQQAKAVICLSNLHQWAVAAAMYAIDNDGWFLTGEMRRFCLNRHHEAVNGAFLGGST